MIFNKTDIEVVKKLILLKIKENINNRSDVSHFTHHVDGYYFKERISTVYLVKLLSKIDKTSYESIKELYEKYLETFPKESEQIKF